MVAGLLVWLALVTQVGAPAFAAIAMGGPVDPLAYAQICTADGHPAEGPHDGPPLPHPCCDTLCQIALASGTLLAPVGAELPSPDPCVFTLTFATNLQTPSRRAFYRPNARAPPVASLITEQNQ
jgi:hypothetical protein